MRTLSGIEPAMRPSRWMTALPLATMALVPPLTAQVPFPSGKNLTATVSVTDVAPRGDSLRIAYRVSNAAGGQQSARAFVVRTTLDDYRLSFPDFWSAQGGMMRDSAAAQWFTGRGSAIAPGQSATGFAMTGIGWLDIVSYRVQGQYYIPESHEAADSVVQVAVAPSFWANAFAGRTLGLTVPRPGVTPFALAQRLDSLAAQACTLGWIQHQASCVLLRLKIHSATEALEHGQPVAARVLLDLFVIAVEAQRGKLIDNNAYWLLKRNAEMLIARL